MSPANAPASPLSAPPVLLLRDSPWRAVVAALLFAGMFLCYAQRGALSVAAPYLMRELSLSPGVMGMLLSAFFWPYLLLQVPSGSFADRLGPRRVYALGMLICSAATALTGFVGGLWALWLTRMASGIGQAVSFPATSRAVATWFRDQERGQVTALYLCGVRLGQAAVSAGGVYLIARYGWAMLFAVVGVAGLLWVVPWSLFLRRHDTAAASATSSSATLSQGLALLRQRSGLGIFLGFFAHNYAWNLYTAWLPGYLRLERKFSAQDMGFYSATPFVVMAAVILASGTLSDWIVRRGAPEVRVRRTFVLVGMLTGCLIVPAGFVQDNTTALWLITLSLCGIGISGPNAWTLTQAVTPKGFTGTTAGLQNFGGNIGAALAPALTGFVVQATDSFAMAFVLSGAILVAGVLAYALLVGTQLRIGSRPA